MQGQFKPAAICFFLCAWILLLSCNTALAKRYGFLRARREPLHSSADAGATAEEHHGAERGARWTGVGARGSGKVDGRRNGCRPRSAHLRLQRGVLDEYRQREQHARVEHGEFSTSVGLWDGVREEQG